MYRTLLFSGGLIIAVATMFPSAEDMATEQATTGKPRGVDTSDWAKTGNKVDQRSQSPGQGQLQSQNGGQVSAWQDGHYSLLRQSDGHFYADGSVQGTSTRFLVDTGASVIALTGADARAAGLSWSSADIKPIGTGASGAVYGVGTMIKEVEIGGINQRNVRAVIIPEGLEISLLGQSFLSQVDSVEIVKNRMIWRAD